MRVAFSVPSHAEYVPSGTPSEPILAEAAALEMAGWRAHNNNDRAAYILDTYLERGLIDGRGRGQIDGRGRGQLVARLLLVLAYDRAIVCQYGVKKTDGGFLYSLGCPLTVFLEELFGQEAAAAVLSSAPDTSATATTLGETFAQA